MTKINKIEQELEEINNQINKENDSFSPIQEAFLNIEKEYRIKEKKHLDLIHQFNIQKERLENEKNKILYNTWNFKGNTYQYLGKSKIENDLYVIPNKGFICEIHSEKCLLVPLKYTIRDNERRSYIKGFNPCFTCEDVEWKGYEKGYFGSYDPYYDDYENPNENIYLSGYGLLGIKLHQENSVVCGEWRWNYDYYVFDDGPYTETDYLRIAFDLDEMDIESIDNYEAFMHLENAPINF